MALWKRRRRKDQPPRETTTVIVDNPWSVVLELASLRLESGDVEFAEEQFRQVMENGDPPSAAIAGFNLGQVLRRRGDLIGAQNAYRRAALADDLDLAGQSGINLAYVLKELGDRSGAEECLRSVAGAGHRDHGPRAAVELARMALDDGRAEAAAEVFRQVIATNHPSEAAAASFYLAQLLAKRGHLDDAEETLAPVLDAGEGDFWAPGHLLLGEICRLRGDTSGARRRLAVARVHGDEQIAGMAQEILRRLPPEASEAETEAGTQARSGSEAEPESEPESRAGVLTRLADGIAHAQEAGRQGRTDEAVARYAELVHTAEGALGHVDENTLAIRHQLAHWTGESGDAEGAVNLFERLLADRADLQGPDHPDTELAHHQLAHWHGRAGRAEEAVRRYDELYRAAEAAGKTETALDLLCNVGYWQQEGGDTAAALRTFTQLLQTAERELGRDHEIADIARQRYAELAGTLPFGHERGHDSLEDLIAATREVERSGDLRRAIRMHGQVAEKCEQLYGAASEQTLNARKAQALTAVRAQEWTQARQLFQHVLDCLQLRGQGPGDVEYDQLAVQRDELARLGHKRYFRIHRQVGTLVANEVEPAPETAFGVLSRTADETHAAHLLAIRRSSGGPGAHEMTEEQWDMVFRRLAEQRHRPLALYFARADRRPSPQEGALCERLGLLGVYVSRESADTVHMEAYSFRDGEPVEASVVVVADEDGHGQSDTSQRQPGVRMAFNPRAEALGDWREVKRAQPARAPDDPDTLGAYEVLERVGEGGFGRVYLCRDADGMLVAVKTLHARHAAASHIRQGFTHEVQAALRVSGRFTVPVIAADTGGATPWLAVPYVAAPSLQELAEHCGPLDEATVRILGAGIASALTAIHAEGIVHLDLKPGNVLLTQDGPRVIDFGIAQIEHLTKPRQGFTGTYGYASPEQLDGIAHFMPASDVFSLGTLLARLALGHSPWPGDDMMSVVRRIRSATPDLTGLPGGLEQVVRSCLSLRPADRPTPAEVAAALAPDVAADRISAPTLSEAARELLDEYATLPAAHRLATLPYTQVHSARDTTAADPRAVGAEQTTVSAWHAVSSEDTVRERRTAADTTVPGQHTVAFDDSTVAGQRPVSEQTTVTAAASVDDDPPVTAVTTVPSAPQAAARDTTRDAARDLESRIRQWEIANEGKPLVQVRRECGAFSDEAHERLGAQHPLTLRLRVSHALLGLSDEPDAVARAQQVVIQAALHLGEGHPTVRDARAMLALLRTEQGN